MPWLLQEVKTFGQSYRLLSLTHLFVITTTINIMTTINITIKMQTSAWVSISIRSAPLICLVLSCLVLSGLVYHLMVGLITHLKTNPNSTLLELRGELGEFVSPLMYHWSKKKCWVPDHFSHHRKKFKFLRLLESWDCSLLSPLSFSLHFKNFLKVRGGGS